MNETDVIVIWENDQHEVGQTSFRLDEDCLPQVGDDLALKLATGLEEWHRVLQRTFVIDIARSEAARVTRVQLGTKIWDGVNDPPASRVESKVS